MSIAPPEKRAAHNPLKTIPFAVAVWVGVVGSVLGVTRTLPAFPRTLDALVRNQRVIWPLLGLLFGAVVLAVGIRLRRVELRHGGTVAEVFAAPLALPFTIAAVGLASAGAIAGAVKPVPAEFGVDVVVVHKNEPEKKALLLFIHGWRGDAIGTWKKFPALAASDPRLAAYNVWSIDYPTFMVSRNLRIAELSDVLHRVLEKSTNAFAHDRIVVVAHSMGGLVAREITVQRVLRGKGLGFTKLIEIATPHQGANPARLADALDISEEYANDMSAGSGFLTSITTHWNALTPKPPTFCIGSPHDRVVAKESATAQCSDFTNYTSGGHTEIVKPTKYTDLYYAIPVGEIP